jgi:hypothetical protein
VKNGFKGAIPELIRSKLLSFCGMSDELAILKCPLLSKNARNFSLISFTPINCILYFPPKFKTLEALPPNLRKPLKSKSTFAFGKSKPYGLPTFFVGARLDLNFISASPVYILFKLYIGFTMNIIYNCSKKNITYKKRTDIKSVRFIHLKYF